MISFRDRAHSPFSTKLPGLPAATCVCQSFLDSRTSRTLLLSGESSDYLPKADGKLLQQGKKPHLSLSEEEAFADRQDPDCPDQNILI